MLQLLRRVMPMSQVIIMERLELPVLVEVVRAVTQLTLRLYEEVVDGVPNRRGRISGRAALDAEAVAVIGTQASRKFPVPLSLSPVPAIQGDTLGRPGRDFLMLDEMLFDLADRDSLGKEWSDHAVWEFRVSPDGRLHSPFNRMVETAVAKTVGPWHRLRGGHLCPLRVMVPLKAWPLARFSLLVNTHPDFGLIGTIEPTETLPSDVPFVPRESVFPSLKLIGPATVAPNGIAVVEVMVVDGEGAVITDAASEVLLEAVAGILPRTRAVITGGAGTFKVMALCLEAGEAVRVKAGLGLFTGLADISIPVA
ncbi:MAG: hypothetical protein Q7R40_01110 [Phaeospirillum sp.]|nr:hypothetical protein [Phaeospirillum sp.]